MAQHGGARPGAGRPAGGVSEAKRRLSELARDHAGVAVQALADIAANGQSETARISAAVALLDRGFGKPREATLGQYRDPDDDMFGSWP